MKYIIILLSIQFCLICVSAQNSEPAKVILADVNSFTNEWAKEINRQHSLSLDKLQESLKIYQKSYIGIGEQLEKAMETFSVAQNFSNSYPLIAIKNHIEEVQLDLYESITRKRFNETSYKYFVLNLKWAKHNFDKLLPAVDKNPKLANCWWNVRGETLSMFDELLAKSNPAILDETINELNKKLLAFAAEADALVARIKGDLAKCEGNSKSHCISQYVSEKILQFLNGYQC
jgi:hypothetical protein